MKNMILSSSNIQVDVPVLTNSFPTIFFLFIILGIPSISYYSKMLELRIPTNASDLFEPIFLRFTSFIEISKIGFYY